VEARHLDNMATFTEADRRNLLNVIADLPLTFKYTDGTLATFTNAATMGALVTRKDLEDGGFMPEPDLTITTTIKKLDSSDALVDRFTTAPAATNIITIDSVDYRVEATTTDEISSALVLDLNSAEK